MTHVAYAALVLVLVSLLLLGAGAVADEGVARSGERTDITNESFTPTTGSFLALNHSNIDALTYSDEVSVEDENGTHSVEGQDYEWNATDGTIKPLAGGNLDGDSTATIDYTIWNPTAQDDDVAGTIATLVDTGGFIPLMLLIGLVVGAVTVLGGLG